MKNEELIAKIKAEIEKRLALMKELVERKGTCDFALGSIDALQGLLDTVISPKYKVRNPIFDECVANVDQKVREEVRENIDFEQALYDHFGQVKDFTLGMRIGKYFYELGCRRTAEKYDEIEYNRQKAEESVPNDLEEAAGEYEKKHTYQRYDGGGLTPEYDATLAEAVIFGAKWQKEQNDKDLSEKTAAAYQLGLADKEKQMLKEAVEADVMLTLHDKTGDISLHTGYLPKELGIKYGDKVKIIIVKEN